MKFGVCLCKTKCIFMSLVLLCHRPHFNVSLVHSLGIIKYDTNSIWNAHTILNIINVIETSCWC